jgi:hypothetical protein
MVAQVFYFYTRAVPSLEVLVNLWLSGLKDTLSTGRLLLSNFATRLPSRAS